MNDIDDIKRRIEKRKARRHPVLTDHHFTKIYNGMIKAMVALLVGIAICAYVKVSPHGDYIRDYVLNDLQFSQVTKWFNQYFLSFQNQDSSMTVSSTVSYTHVKDNYYKSQTNEVLNFATGRVIYVGKQNLLGNYVTVLLENNVEVTFGNMQDVFVGLYDQVEEATILGTYDNQVMIIFTQGEQEIDYSTFEELIS